MFDRIRTPLVAANALGDLWAMRASRHAFMAGYRHAALRVVDIDPNARGIGPIGHMGYFHQRTQALWEDVWAWFGEESGDDRESTASRVKRYSEIQSSPRATRRASASAARAARPRRAAATAPGASIGARCPQPGTISRTAPGTSSTKGARRATG